MALAWDERWASARDMAAALERRVPLDDTRITTGGQPSGRRRLSWIWVAGIVVLALGGIAALWWMRNAAAVPGPTPAPSYTISPGMQPSPTAAEPVVATVPEGESQVEPTATAAATLAPSPTPTLPQPTSTVAPTPSPTPRPTDTPACPPVRGAFADAWAAGQDRLGCAQGDPFTGVVAEEAFEHGRMFWREPLDTGQALVLYNGGAWHTYQHAPYVEGSPEFPCADADTPAQCPPTPKRGFGAMWCDIGRIRTGLGSALDCERSYTGTMQQFDRGAALRTDAGTIYLFYADGLWERR